MVSLWCSAFCFHSDRCTGTKMQFLNSANKTRVIYFNATNDKLANPKWSLHSSRNRIWQYKAAMYYVSMPLVCWWWWWYNGEARRASIVASWLRDHGFDSWSFRFYWEPIALCFLVPWQNELVVARMPKHELPDRKTYEKTVCGFLNYRVIFRPRSKAWFYLFSCSFSWINFEKCHHFYFGSKTVLVIASFDNSVEGEVIKSTFLKVKWWVIKSKKH